MYFAAPISWDECLNASINTYFILFEYFVNFIYISIYINNFNLLFYIFLYLRSTNDIIVLIIFI